MRDHRQSSSGASPQVQLSRWIISLVVGFSLTYISVFFVAKWAVNGTSSSQPILWKQPVDTQQINLTLQDIEKTKAEIRACTAREGINTSTMNHVVLSSPPFLGQRSMFLYPANDIVSNAIKAGGWEQPEIEQFLWAMHQTLPPDAPPTDLFVDIGANVGWFTLNIASRGYQVDAFEGMESNQKLIEATKCANPDLRSKINLHKHGLGSESKTCYVFSGLDNEGDGVTECAWKSEEEAKKRVPANYALRGKIEITRLDSVLKTSIKAMKMDTEGYEPFILEGASGLFKDHKIWFIALELNSNMVRFMGKIEPLDYNSLALQEARRARLSDLPFWISRPV